jgi:UDP-glucose 4-epimerase
MRVFITGVAGFLGSHLADAFLSAGHTVVGVDNFIGGERDNIPVGVEFYMLDCNEVVQLRALMKGCDLVFHLAATAHEGLSVFSPAENTRHGYSASAAVFSAACANRVRRIVFTSSMARYGRQERTPFTEDMECRPVDPYGVGKLASEQLLKVLAEAHGIEWVVANPHNIYGPRQKYDDPFRNVAAIMTNLMLQGRQPIIYGDGLQERCFSYVLDCIGPLYRMATEPRAAGEVINIGPDTGVITVYRLAEMLAEIIGFKNLKPVHVDDRPCEVKIAHCSADKARRLLDYEPRVGLTDGLHELVQWIRSRGPRPFKYHLGIEIESDKTPITWKERLF